MVMAGMVLMPVLKMTTRSRPFCPSTWCRLTMPSLSWSKYTLTRPGVHSPRPSPTLQSAGCGPFITRSTLAIEIENNSDNGSKSASSGPVTELLDLQFGTIYLGNPRPVSPDGSGARALTHGCGCTPLTIPAERLMIPR